MIRLLTVPINQLKDSEWRNTWKFSRTEDIPLAFLEKFDGLTALVKAGATLIIHVAKIDSDFYILDGHVCVDVYRELGFKEVTVILDDNVQTVVQARERYVAMNCLRADGWLRDGVKLGETLSQIAKEIGELETAKLVGDKELAKHRIDLNDARWWEFNSGEKRPPKQKNFLDD